MINPRQEHRVLAQALDDTIDEITDYPRWLIPAQAEAVLRESAARPTATVTR